MGQIRARSVRVDDALWEQALEAADERGEVLSQEIRMFLRRYIHDLDRPRPRKPVQKIAGC